MTVADNIFKIEERIQKACNRAGRKREEITLMGVSKFMPVEKVREAFSAGIYCFGESRVKEGIEKFGVLKSEPDILKSDKLSVHLIGSLQRNKAKNAALFFDCIQSVDRLELITELEKYAVRMEASNADKLEVLLELHTGEETKSGFADLNGLFKAAEMLQRCENLKPAGLMTMAPFTEDVSLIRNSFRQMAAAQKELEKRFPFCNNDKGSWNCLSMGMSNDFEIAIEEGSTMLRIGSLIFNE